MANQNNSPIGTFIMGMVLIITSWVVYSNISVPMIEESEASENWPTTSGIVTYSDISQSISDGKKMYTAAINYEFLVNNKSYIGDRISLSSNNTSTSNIGKVKKTLQTYPVNSKVTVYYDPELPNNAVLKPGADFFIYFVKYGPYCLGFIGVLMLLQLVKKIGVLILALFLSSRN
ncbi:DUF3592 domain-containing protein [Lutibacter sp. A64]|uniref:DUF3592 domain-containing protein n=1 Tax=Lutibacter sp. A64 TaxID=2918526 RepID=UPI001F0507F1|nr:DUF3592 domain-containing protein [Lutibacter sp. A64]UMB52697.1 DUF3592 domain-containing protein [Lutibacter sp. A64]